MKDMWLYTALCAFVLCLVPETIAWWLMLGFAHFLYRRQQRWCLVSILLLLYLQVARNPEQPKEPQLDQIITIKEIKSNYVIAQTQDASFLLYELEDASLDSQWKIQGTCTTLEGKKNFDLFNFPDYMRRRGIGYGCQVEHAAMVAQGTSLRAKLWENIQGMEDAPKAWLNLMFYGMEEKHQEIGELASSSGMHLSLLSHWLYKFLLLWVSAPMASMVSLFAIFALGMSTTLRDSLFRLLCFRSVATLCSHISTKDQLGIGMLLCLCLRPYLASELTFVLPVCFRLCGSFNVVKRTRKALSFLVLLPLQWHYFNEVDIIQIFLFPLFRIAYALSYALALLYLLFPVSFFHSFATTLLHLIYQISQVQLVFYYHASLWFLLLWFYLAFQWLGRKHKKDALRLGCLLVYTQLAPYGRPYMEVMMIDVGQGDCTLISLPFQQGNILIDVAGNPDHDIPEEIIVPVLHALGITSLDLVIITHDDFDHRGGLPRLQELMEVKHVITEKQEDIQFGQFTFHFLLSEHEFSDANENSILTYLEAYDTTFLFMGDAGKEVEQTLMQTYPSLRADILKVGHHGSKSSSSAPFIHSLHPQIGLISCGAHNFYGHPSPETISTFQQEGVLVLDTPTTGAVDIKCTNFARFYKTATQEFGIIVPGDE